VTQTEENLDLAVAEYLKEHLKVQVTTKPAEMFGPRILRVRILLDDTVISEDGVYSSSLG